MPPAGKQVISPQAAFIVTDILAGNTNPSVNPFWGKFAITGPDGRRPATLKTGTNNDAKDLNAYGYIAPPTDAGRKVGAYALAVGVWNGNSDNSLVSTARSPLFSIDVSTYVWQGFLNEATAKWPETNFKPPADGLVRVKIDPFTGYPATSDKNAVNEWFIAGTRAEEPARIRTRAASTSSPPSRSRPAFDAWMKADRDWLRRAGARSGRRRRSGPDADGLLLQRLSSIRTASSWGVLVGGSAGRSPSPTCFVVPTPDPSGVVPSFAAPTPDGSGGRGAPLPDRHPVRVAECGTVGGGDAATERATTDRADADADADARRRPRLRRRPRRRRPTPTTALRRRSPTRRP